MPYPPSIYAPTQLAAAGFPFGVPRMPYPVMFPSYPMASHFYPQARVGGAPGPVGPHPANSAAYVNRVAAHAAAAAAAAAAAVYHGAPMMRPHVYPMLPNPYFMQRVVPVIHGPPVPPGTVSWIRRNY